MGFVLQITSILLAFFLVLLIVPITLSFRVGRIAELKGQVTINWLFGLVRFRISIPTAAKAEPQHKKKARKRKWGGNMRRVLVLLKQPAFRRRAIRFIKSLIHATHARDLYLRLRIGLDDPADTGRLWGVLGPMAGIAINLRRARIFIEPEFMATMLELESHGEIRLIPIQFIALAASFIVSPTSLHALYTLRRSNA